MASLCLFKTAARAVVIGRFTELVRLKDIYRSDKLSGSFGVDVYVGAANAKNKGGAN